MSQSMGTNQKNYGSTNERVPNVSFSGVQFSPTEMFDLSENVTANIYNINSHSKKFEQALKTIGTQKDSQLFRDEMQSNLHSANKVVTQTTKDLNKLSSIVKKGDKRQKLQVEKLTNTFKEAVQMYSKVQKQLVEKMTQNFVPSEIARRDDEEAAFRLSQGAVGGNDEINAAELRLETKALEFEQGLLIEREQRIKEIESCVLDINQIMKELASSVFKQAEDINSIENAIEDVHSNVEAGNEELEKAASYQNKRRRTTCVLFGISVTVGIILAIIIAVSLRKPICTGFLICSQ
ncbi:syntaxin 13 isoform X2 [Rhodnius prolixus]